MIGMVGHCGRISGFLDEIQNAVVVIHLHDAKAGGFLARHRDTPDGHIGAAFDMLLDHQGIVLLVDMITGKNDDVFRAVAFDDVDVLGYRIGSTLVPVLLIQTLRGGQDIQRFVAFGAKEAPTALQMADQAVRFVLRRNANPADARN